MISDDEIFELASNLLRYFEDGWNGTEWRGTPEQLLKFALVIHENGYNKGYGRGYDEGYESAKVGTEMNTMEFGDD